MNKELLFAEVKESIKRTRSIKLQNGQFTLLQDNTVIGVNAQDQVFYSCYIPYEFEGETINLRTRKALAQEFINTFNFLDLQNEYIAEEQVKELQFNKALEELPQLEELKNKLDNILGMYYARESSINYNTHRNAYVLDVTVRKDKLHNDGWMISNKNNKFEVLFEQDNLTLEETIAHITKDINLYKAYAEEKYQQNILKEKELNNKIYVANFVGGLKAPEGCIIIFKNKKSYFAWSGNYKYAIGTGKSGKFVKCDRYKIEDMILKGLNEYTIAEDRSYSTEELNKMDFHNIRSL